MGDVPPQPDLVRGHLARILAHPEFTASPQLAAFLAYVVERRLEGAEDRIKAYSIATEALGRPASFDPQSDPIVRVQARRLRQALQSYYLAADPGDPLRITLPVGSYVPEITSGVPVAAEDGVPAGSPELPLPPPRPAPRRSSRFAGAALAVALLALLVSLWANLPLIRTSWEQYVWHQPEADPNPLGMPALVVRIASERQIPGWFSPQLFAKGLETNLAKFDEFVVMAPVRNRPLADTDYRLDLIFTGTTSAVLGSARLMRGNAGQILWNNRFTVPEDSIDAYELIDPVRRLASTLGQPYGVLYAHVLGDPLRNPDQACLLSGYEWFQNPAKDGIEPVRRCLEDVLARKPGNHVAYMMLAYIHVARFRWGTGEGAVTELTRALNMAKRAQSLRPDSAGVHQAMMEVQWAREKFDLAEEAGRKAVSLNPNSSDVVADLGCRLIYSGKYSEGSTYTERAARWNMLPPVWHQFCRFIAAYNTGNLKMAHHIADMLDGQDGPEALIPAILMASRGGTGPAAAVPIQRLLDYDPACATDAGPLLARIGLRPQAADPLIAALKAALRASGAP